MAETNQATPTKVTTAKAPTQAKQSGNMISWLAPLLCLVAGYLIWRFIIGNPSGFEQPDPAGGFWPKHVGPKSALSSIYEGGIIIPILIGLLIMAFVFFIERMLTISRAKGRGNPANFVRKVQYHLANKNVEAALAECDKQRGSVGNVMKAGLSRYKELISDPNLTIEQKVLSIQKEVEEATALELPMLQRNMVFLSTITTIGVMVALLGTVLGMIRSFAALGEEGGGGNATQLAIGIAEALYNTALGISTSAIALVFYNMLTTRIDNITNSIDEAGFTLTQSFASLYK